MKKCPYCAEEIQDEAVKCKHCGSSLFQTNTNQNVQQQSTFIDKKAQSKENKRFLKYFGLTCLGLIIIIFWYFTLPIVIAFGFYKIFKKINPKKRLVISVLIYFVLAPFGLWFIRDAQKTLIITITEPQNNVSVQADKIMVKGSIQPKNIDELKVNGTKVETQNGNFEKEVGLNSETNTITVSATRNSKNATATIMVGRIFTPEEKAEMEKKRAEAKAEREKRQAEEEKRRQEEEKAKKEADARNDGSIAQVCAQMRVENMLKAPKTADFPTTSNWKITALGDNEYELSSYVDAENSFGANIRTFFTCKITVVSPNEFSCTGTCEFLK